MRIYVNLRIVLDTTTLHDVPSSACLLALIQALHPGGMLPAELVSREAEGASKQGKQTQTTKRSLSSLVRVSGVVALGEGNATSQEEQTGASSESGMLESTNQQQGDELGKHFESLLVGTLDAVELVVVWTVHEWVLDAELLACLSHLERHPGVDEYTVDGHKHDVPIVLRQHLQQLRLNRHCSSTA